MLLHLLRYLGPEAPDNHVLKLGADTTPQFHPARLEVQELESPIAEVIGEKRTIRLVNHLMDIAKARKVAATGMLADIFGLSLAEANRLMSWLVSHD